MTTYSHSRLEKTANLLREAIPRMSQLNIPLTPENYHTWYEYTTGDIAELNSAIDELIDKGEKFTSKVNSELYFTYVNKPQDKAIKPLQLDLKQLVSKLLGNLGGMTHETQVFSASLEKYNTVLHKEPDLNAITDLITHLIDDTSQLLETNRAMEKNLVALSQEADSLRNNIEKLSVEAFTDQLTVVSNRRAFDKRIDEMFECYHDSNKPFSLLLIDIDHFKKFNDTHGHAIGDRVLRYVASILKGGIKGDDFIARYGGEEFALLLPDTSYDDAIAVANQLCKKIATRKLVDSTKDAKSLGNVTISIGVAVSSKSDDIDTLVDRADTALYRAKDSGRNRTVGEQEI